MLIDRTIFKSIRESLLGERRVIVLYGPRQSGKTTLLKQLVKEYPAEESFFLNGDDFRVAEIFKKPSLANFKSLIGSKKLLIIDEAQRITDIGLSLKLIFDQLSVRVIVSGSSSLGLADSVSEPLTGRTKTFFLYPLSFNEIKPIAPEIGLSTRLEEFLRFGLYPKVVTTEGDQGKQDYLNELLSAYLYGDILAFGLVRKPKKVIDLLSLLALQIGSEVSIAELAANLSLSRVIVEKYLDLLEKMFVLVNLRGFSRNLRKEISKTSKYYFVDLGLRNALIRNFNPLNLRNDVGALFENFCFIERQKLLGNRGQSANFYFWRTYDQKEIDLIEEKDGQLLAWEFKWSKKARPSSSSFEEFQDNYPQSQFRLVSADNFEDLGQN
ncbi:MAG: ATP-binding protein [Patescibacteria group bacterium]